MTVLIFSLIFSRSKDWPIAMQGLATPGLEELVFVFNGKTIYFVEMLPTNLVHS